MPKITGFRPSTRGFHFPNSFPSVPDITIPTPFGNIGIGDASNGLCGGMVFAVRDCFENRIPVPPDTKAPSAGPLFDFIVLRLMESFNLFLPPPPAPPPFIAPTPPFGPGPVTYLYLMDPRLSDHETVASNAGLAPHGRAWIMINDQWPKIKQMIDSGHPAPLALIEVHSMDPTLIGENHQVLAYGYELNGTDLKIDLYDPNHPDDDNLTMSLSLADPQHTTPITYSTGEMIWCFFLVIYLPVSPPLQDSSRIGVAANDGRVFVKEGPLDAGWILESENCRQVALAGDRIGVLLNDDQAFVKEGPLDAQWVLESENCAQIALTRNRIGVLLNDGQVFVKEGPLDAHWVLESENCAQIALTRNRIGVLLNDGQVLVKEGPLGAQWVLASENCRQVALSGDRIGVLLNDGQVFVKEGPLDAQWVLESKDCRQVALSGDRIGVLLNDGQVFVKEGLLDAQWVLESSEVQSFALEALSHIAT